MPIYAYRCADCGHTKDVLQKLSDPVLSTCPACGKDSFAKQLTAAGFQLKGSGWYATDFKNSGSKPPAKDAAKPDAKADAPAGAAGDAKPETSTAAKSDAPAASPAGKSADPGKSESRSTSDKPAASGTTTGGS